MNPDGRQQIFAFVAAIILGYISWELPLFLFPGKSSTWILILTSLAVTGIVVGFLSPNHWLANGAATMLLVFLINTGEAAFEKVETHRLLGVEWIIYGFLTVPAMIAAFLGSFIRRRWLTSL